MHKQVPTVEWQVFENYEEWARLSPLPVAENKLLLPSTTQPAWLVMQPIFQSNGASALIPCKYRWLVVAHKSPAGCAVDSTSIMRNNLHPKGQQLNSKHPYSSTRIKYANCGRTTGQPTRLC